MKFKVQNPNSGGVQKSVSQKINESKKHYGVDVKIIDGERAAFGNANYSIIKTNQMPNSDFIQSLEYDCKVTEIN